MKANDDRESEPQRIGRAPTLGQEDHWPQGRRDPGLDARAATDSSPHWQALADGSSRVVQARRQAEQVVSGPASLTIQAFQQMADNSARHRHARRETSAHSHGSSGAGKAPIQRREQKPDTGLAPQLKAGIEALSGISMDHVQVHFNSGRPAQLQAHAFAQGHEIHVAPGQEQHLPHEAWHVVQQAQGRVAPTLQTRDGLYVNDDAGLEKEADQMGARASEAGRRIDQEAKPARAEDLAPLSIAPAHSMHVQRMKINGQKATVEAMQHGFKNSLDKIKAAYNKKYGDDPELIDWVRVEQEVLRVAGDERDFDFDGTSTLVHAIVENDYSADKILEDGPVTGSGEDAWAEDSAVMETPDYVRFNEEKNKKKWVAAAQPGSAEQARIHELFAQIRQSKTLTLYDAKSKKKGRAMDCELSADNFQALYDGAAGLAGLLKTKGFIAYPGDILDPAALNDEKNAATVLLTLNKTIPFLEAVLTILSDGEQGPAFVFSKVPNEIILSNFGKNCITSIGADVLKAFGSVLKKGD